MNTARAAVLEAFNAPLVAREYALPDELPAGAVLVRTEMAGICGTDVHLWRGELPITLPVILGHETVGTVVAVADGGVPAYGGGELKIGDRVTWNSATSCGECFYCREKGQPTRCPQRRAYGIGYRSDEAPHFLGGYAEYHYLQPRATIFRIDDDLPTEAVIGAGCALNTALHGVDRTGIAPGDQVVVQGCGPVGIAALAVAKAAGAGKVIVVGAPGHRLVTAQRFGADGVIDLEEMTDPADRIAWVREQCGGHGADVVLECTGRPQAVAEGFEMCRDGAKYLVLGHYCDAGPTLLNPHVITRKQLQVIGAWSSEPRHLERALEFLQIHRERFPFADLVTHRFGLAEAQTALMTTADWAAAKCVIVP